MFSKFDYSIRNNQGSWNSWNCHFRQWRPICSSFLASFWWFIFSISCLQLQRSSSIHFEFQWIWYNLFQVCSDSTLHQGWYLSQCYVWITSWCQSWWPKRETIEELDHRKTKQGSKYRFSSNHNSFQTKFISSWWRIRKRRRSWLTFKATSKCITTILYYFTNIHNNLQISNKKFPFQNKIYFSS